MTLQRLRGKFNDAVLDSREFRGETTATVALGGVLDALRFLKDEGKFDFLADLCGADYPGREERFEVVYHLMNMATGERFRLKTRVAEGQSVPSATPLWQAANWLEREAYDMYGIHFLGHPNLIRILMFDGFEGHPLRKDFPVKGLEAPEDRYAKDDKRLIEE